MPTTADYLTQLQSDRNALADNLVTMGVEASQSETFTSLVPKVLDIQGGGSDFPTVSYTFTSDFSGLSTQLLDTYIKPLISLGGCYYIRFVNNSTENYFIVDAVYANALVNAGGYFFRKESGDNKCSPFSSVYSSYVKAGTEMIIYTLTPQG